MSKMKKKHHCNSLYTWSTLNSVGSERHGTNGESISISFKDINLTRSKTRKTDIYDLISVIHRRKIIQPGEY